jgi:enoyl-CoA hydratase
MNEFRYIQIEIEEGIGIVGLNNPPSNFLSRRLVEELMEIFQRFSTDTLRAIIVTGTGKIFSPGVDPAEISQLKSAAEGKEAASAGQEILNQVERSRKPVIAAINGLCLGGGLELAMACHLRFCSDRARLGLPEITLGLIPGLGGTQRLSRLVGIPRALDLILTGDTIKAEEAREIGLVDRVVPADEVLKEAVKFTKRLVKREPGAVAAALESIIEGSKLSLEEGLKLEAEAFGRLCESGEKEKRIQYLLS